MHNNSNVNIISFGLQTPLWMQKRQNNLVEGKFSRRVAGNVDYFNSFNMSDWVGSNCCFTGYMNTSRFARNAVNCDYDDLPKPWQVCVPDYTTWFPCTKENNFGFHKASPCVFIRFNKVNIFSTLYSCFYSNVWICFLILEIHHFAFRRYTKINVTFLIILVLSFIIMIFLISIPYLTTNLISCERIQLRDTFSTPVVEL
jgi:hypothetical protein